MDIYSNGAKYVSVLEYKCNYITGKTLDVYHMRMRHWYECPNHKLLLKLLHP